MRRFFAVLMMMTLVLTGCQREASLLEEAITFRAELVQAGGCSFRGEITADFGDRVETFTVDCEGTEEGQVLLTLAEPEILSGITATVAPDGGKITYDGLGVDFGSLAQGNVIPAAAPAMVLSCWREAYISAAGIEGDFYRVTYKKDYEEKQLIVETYFKNHLPNFAEVCYNNQTVLKLRISEFQFNEG